MPPTTSENRTSSFEADVREAMRRAREGFGKILESLPGGPTRPNAVQNALNLDKKLAWKLARLVEEADPFTGARFVPGHTAVRRILRAAEREGVPKRLLSEAQEAVEGFEALVRRHATDRTSFEMMLAGFSREPSDATDLACKRMAYQGNSYILGVRARTQLITMFVAPGADPTQLDVVGVHGFVDLRRLRPGAPLVVSRVRASDDEGAVRRLPFGAPLDSEAPTLCGVAPVRPFCTPRAQQFREVELGNGYIHVELTGEGVGDTAAETYISGIVLRGVLSRYRDPHDTEGHSHANVRIPSEALVMDLVVRRDTFGPLEPEVATFAEHSGGPPVKAPGRERDRLPFDEQVESVGRGAAALRSVHVPRYPEIGSYVFDRMGWEESEFQVYRYQTVFPVVPSSAVLSFPLPPAPGTPGDQK